MAERTYLKPKVLKSSDTLVVEEINETFLPKEKFVRKRDKVLTFNRKTIATHKISVPYKIEEVKRVSQKLASGYFQTDDMYITREWIEKVKTYDEPALSDFIKDVMAQITFQPQMRNVDSADQK